MFCFPTPLFGLLAFLQSAICDNIDDVSYAVGFEVGGERDVSAALEAPAEGVSEKS